MEHIIAAQLPPDIINIIVNAVIAVLTWLLHGAVNKASNGKPPETPGK